MSDALTYSEAYEELQQIVREMEEGEISVDQLAEKTKRATVLIARCRQVLTETEEDVEKILAELKEK